MFVQNSDFIGILETNLIMVAPFKLIFLAIVETICKCKGIETLASVQYELCNIQT